MQPSELDTLLAAFRAEIRGAASPQDVEATQRKYLGRKSQLKGMLKSLRKVPAEDRPKVAQAINEVHQTMEQEAESARTEVEQKALAAKLDREWADLTMPGIATPRGARHPLTEVELTCMNLLRRLGFELVDGPEVDSPYYNFDALNIPEHHPARDMQDTFWVQGNLLLRSHTTTVQARVLQKKPPLPIRIMSAGRVYRNEAVDASHTAMFHQFEGLWIDKGLTFAHLKGVLAFVVRELYGDKKIRFKPKFYPYTEPSMGVDLCCDMCDGAGCEACHGAGWVTILGSGMVHPKVFLEFGYDPNEVSGIAFGLGTTRMAAQKSGIPGLKPLYEQDLRVFHSLHRGVR